MVPGLPDHHVLAQQRTVRQDDAGGLSEVHLETEGKDQSEVESPGRKQLTLSSARRTVWGPF